MTGLAGGFASILLLRLLLGLGESVTFPSWQLILARQTVEHERGRANGFVGAGQGIGPMLGTLFGGLAMVHFGWRAMFIGLGIITMLWLWPWFLVTAATLRCTGRARGAVGLLLRRSCASASSGAPPSATSASTTRSTSS